MDGESDDIDYEPFFENKFIICLLWGSWSAEIDLVKRISIHYLEENVIEDSSREENKTGNASKQVVRSSSGGILPIVILGIVTHCKSWCQSKFDNAECDQTHIAETKGIQNDIQSHHLGDNKCLAAIGFVVKDIRLGEDHLMNQSEGKEDCMDYEQQLK